MKKSEVCVKLTRKNCKKVLEILEMFGEPVFNPDATEWRVGKIWSNDTYAILDIGSEWTGHTESVKNTGYSDRIIIKPKQLKQILAKEHLKEGDVVILDADSKTQYVAKIDSVGNNQWGDFSSTLWAEINTDDKTIETQEGLFDNFLRYATEEEKALLEPKKVKSVEWSINPQEEPDCFITLDKSVLEAIFSSGNRFTTSTETVTKEVWVNIFPNGIKAHDKEEAALFAASLSNDVATVKGTLTYDIPMTKV